MAGWTDPVVQILSDWSFKIAVIIGLVSHLVLVLFAWVRRHEAFGLLRAIVWVAYQLPDWALGYVLGNLYLSTTQQPIVAFWVPFLLQSVRPDNICAFSDEDIKLSLRAAFSVVMQVTGAIYVLYRHIITSSARATSIFPASIFMYILGIAKYVEKPLALWLGDLGVIRNSSKRHPPIIITNSARLRGPVLNHEQAQITALGLLSVSRRAMADSAVVNSSPDLHASREIFSFVWEDMLMVVEMQISFMFDILYTKAAVVYTWWGYFIRFVSPFATAAACLLFHSYWEVDQNRADTIVTYILLGAAFLLDLRWLFGALASTWTHEFIRTRSCSWVQAVLCPGRWHRLRCLVLSLDVRRLVLLVVPNYKISNYRSWSDTVGRYSLLEDCTSGKDSFVSKLIRKIGLEYSWYEYHYSKGTVLPQGVKRLVFQRVQQALKGTYMEMEVENKVAVDEKVVLLDEEITPCSGHQHSSSMIDMAAFNWHLRTEILQSTYDNMGAANFEGYNAAEDMPNVSVPRRTYSKSMKDITTSWGQVTDSTREEKLQRFDLSFGDEIQEDILVWHIATQVFVSCVHDSLITGKEEKMHLTTIKALSTYLMFLVVVRPSMIPGRRLRSLYEESREALKKIWSSSDEDKKTKNYYHSCRSTAREYMLAMVLQCNCNSEWGLKDDRNRLVSDGVKLALELLKADQSEMPSLLELIFNVWVDKLLYVSTQCSGDSHARQIGRGGELTTIIWILAEHAGSFRIGDNTEAKKVK